MLEKIRQKNIPKESEGIKATKPAERMYIDISSMKHNSLGGQKHWVLMICEKTNFKTSFFTKKKSDQNKLILEWIHHIKKKYNHEVEYIRLDNSGENNALEKMCLSAGLGIVFEYTVPGTPQQNSLVERAFPTLIGRGRALMNHAGFTTEMRKKMWCESAATATLLDDLMV